MIFAYDYLHVFYVIRFWIGGFAIWIFEAIEGDLRGFGDWQVQSNGCGSIAKVLVIVFACEFSVEHEYREALFVGDCVYADEGDVFVFSVDGGHALGFDLEHFVAWCVEVSHFKCEPACVWAEASSFGEGV